MVQGRYGRVSVEEFGGKQQSLVDIAASLGIIEYTEYPFALGYLTVDGTQYCTEVLAATATTEGVVETVTIDPDCDGDVIQFEFALTAAFKATASTTCTVGYYWRAKNATSSTWVNLHPGSTIAAAVGTDYSTEPTWSGRFNATTNLNRVPFDVALFFQCSTGTEGYAKTKNSSYVKVIYKAD